MVARSARKTQGKGRLIKIRSALKHTKKEKGINKKGLYGPRPKGKPSLEGLAGGKMGDS